MCRLNLVNRVSFTFLTSKVTELLWRSLFPSWMTHGTSYLSDGCLFVQSLLWIFLTERLDTIDKIWFFVIIFYCTINRKRSSMRIFPKIALIPKKHPLIMTSVTFLFKEVEQLTVYQLLPNLTIWEDFGCLLAVNQWACEHLCKTSIQRPGLLSSQQCSQPLYQSILITTLGSVGCYILLLPACKIETRMKRQLFWQVGDEFTMRVTPAWCRWVIIEVDFQCSYWFYENNKDLEILLFKKNVFRKYFWIFFVLLQSWERYFKQFKDLMKNCIGLENFDICFSVTFGNYCEYSIPGKIATDQVW